MTTPRHSRHRLTQQRRTTPLLPLCRSEVYLNYSGSQVNEHNWVPLVHAGELYVLIQLCPARVLRCDPDSGRCERAFAAQSLASAGCAPGLRGGSPLVQLGSRLVGVAHRTTSEVDKGGGRGVGRRYTHQFFALAPAPPFTMLNDSAEFTFPAFFNSSLDRIQFCSGLALRNGHDLAISYGAGDCAALQVHLPRHRVLQWVGGGGTATKQAQ